jgi:signal peptidase I
LLKALGIVVVAAAVAAFLFVVLFVRPYRIPSSSMEPTYHCARPAPGCEGSADDRFLVLKLGGVGRGDVVAFKTPELARERCGAGGTYVKRVIGLPGDTVAERNGVVSVDGQPLDEPYVGHRDDTPARRWHVPAGSYFLLGDNRPQSCDSRVFGAVPRRNVIGRVVFVYWPPGRLGFR